MADTADQLENRRILIAEDGEWARHYSNVRMTVITFVVTACVAILALKWDADIEKKPTSAPAGKELAASTLSNATPAELVALKEKRARAKTVATTVALLWILGSLVFQGFTYYSMKRMAAELKHRARLLVDGDDPKKLPSHPGFDWPSLAPFAISVLFAFCLATTNAGEITGVYLQVAIYLLAIESLIAPIWIWKRLGG